MTKDQLANVINKAYLNYYVSGACKTFHTVGHYLIHVLEQHGVKTLLDSDSANPS